MYVQSGTVGETLSLDPPDHHPPGGFREPRVPPLTVVGKGSGRLGFGDLSDGIAIPSSQTYLQVTGKL